MRHSNQNLWTPPSSYGELKPYRLHTAQIYRPYIEVSHITNMKNILIAQCTHTRTQILIAHTKNKILERHQARSCSLLCRLFIFLSFLRPKPHNIPLLSTCNLQIATKIVYRRCVFFSLLLFRLFLLVLVCHWKVIYKIFSGERFSHCTDFIPNITPNIIFSLDTKQIFRIGLLEFQRLW